MWSNTAILAFSHLRWEHVYQRPQHLLSRLAKFHKVVFIEEPEYVPKARSSSWAFSRPESNVLVCRPKTTLPGHGFNSDNIPMLSRLLAELLQKEHLEE